MAKPKDCSGCTKPATIHLTQIVNSQIKKLDFCEDCPHQKGVTDPEGFSLAELLAAGPLAGAVAAGQPACGHCGLTPHDFKKSGRLGCGECYTSFRELLVPMLKTMHRGLSHAGKVPSRMLERFNRQREFEELRKELEQAVREERFEDAARHRDSLRQLEINRQEAKAGGQSSDTYDKSGQSG